MTFSFAADVVRVHKTTGGGTHTGWRNNNSNVRTLVHWLRGGVSPWAFNVSANVPQKFSSRRKRRDHSVSVYIPTQRALSA